jgi:tetratricopeptide (TPR) repeat protein
MRSFRDPNKKGVALMAKGQHGLAIEEFKRVLVKDPKNWQTYAYLGDVYRRLGNSDEAISSYNNSIYYNPEAVESYVGLAIVYADKGIKFDEAIEFLNKTQQILKDDKFALEVSKDSYLESLGWVYYKKGDIAKALTFYDKAYPIWQKNIEIGVDQFDPYFAETHYHFGMFFLLKHEPEKAREEFEKAIESSPNSFFAKQALKELNKITPALAPSLVKHSKSIEHYGLDKSRKRLPNLLSSFPWKTAISFTLLAFFIAWYVDRFFFSSNLRKYLSYFEGRHPLLFYAIGTFILSIILFPAFNKMETEKRTGFDGVSQQLNWASLGLGFILFICSLILFIYHLIIFIISTLKAI